jgi:hypothetical protein
VSVWVGVGFDRTGFVLVGLVFFGVGSLRSVGLGFRVVCGFVGVTVGRDVVFSTSVGVDGGVDGRVGLFAAIGVADGLGLSSTTGKACWLDW